MARSESCRPGAVTRSRWTQPLLPVTSNRRVRDATRALKAPSSTSTECSSLPRTSTPGAIRLRELMEGDWGAIRDQTSWAPERFTPQVYEQVMSGKPRMSGARAALDYFNVPDADKRVGVLRRSQAVDGGPPDRGRTFKAYPDALRFILAVRAAGIRVAAASSSKNAKLFLRNPPRYVCRGPGSPLRLRDSGAEPPGSLRRRRSGRDFAHGRPDPEIFLTAAAELGAAPQRCFVIEDAVSGIRRREPAGWPRWAWPVPTTPRCSPGGCGSRGHLAR